MSKFKVGQNVRIKEGININDYFISTGVLLEEDAINWLINEKLYIQQIQKLGSTYACVFFTPYGIIQLPQEALRPLKNVKVKTKPLSEVEWLDKVQKNFA